jgi:hypothetical protein
MRSPVTVLLRSLAAFALLAPVSLITTLPVSAAPLSAVGACSTDIGNAGGEGIICQITIVNTVTASGGSAVVTVYECLGSAGDPTDGALGHACTTTTTSLTTPVTSIIQCDGSANGGGAKLLCSVDITTNFVGVSPGSTAVTVNQCVGSGASITPNCNPVQATTSAAITQCNGSANGGGAGLTCTATGTMASALIVTIDQCNGSANGGGATVVVCSSTMANNAVAAAASASASAGASASASAGASASASAGASAAASAAASGTPPISSTASEGSGNGSPAPMLPLMVSLILAGLATLLVVAQRRTIRG